MTNQTVEEKPKPKEHVHSYRRKRNNKNPKNPIYYCVLPNCYHKLEREFLNGKMSVCSGCGRTFQLDWKALWLAVPKCPGCRNDKSGQFKQAASNLLAELGLDGSEPNIEEENEGA
jgi:hypothetical protein